MSDYPDNWFARLEHLAQRPDLLSGVEMSMVASLLHTRGPPNAAEAATVERAWQRFEDDGLQTARRIAAED